LRYLLKLFGKRIEVLKRQLQPGGHFMTSELA
jgi:hypothetical protein